MKRLKSLIFFLLPNLLFTQPSKVAVNMEEETKSALTFAKTINANDLKAHLSVIASDAYEGRETGMEGQRKAAAYIANYFKELGLPPVVKGESYFQAIAFSGERWDEINLTVNKKKFKNLWNYFAFPYSNQDELSLEAKEVVFLGYGIDDPKYSDYKGTNVKGKVILIYSGEPTNAQGISYLTGTEEPSDWTNNWKRKLEAAQKYGVGTVLIIDGEIQKSIAEHRRFLLSPSLKIKENADGSVIYPNNLFVSTDVVKAITGKKNQKFIQTRDAIKSSGKPKSTKLKTKFKLKQKKWKREIIGSNVLGYIEGTDPKLKDELIVVTAHYDHLGKKGESIFNGADDNGTGTSTVLEIAEALTLAKKAGHGPRRSVLCMLVSGEEKGLLGSEYYTSFPIFPLENTVANVNVDMIGRQDKLHQDNPNYIYVIGADRLSSELHEINEAMNKQYTKIELDYTFNDPRDPNRFYERSDHYNFAKNNIPAIFYFSGVHPDYHRPSDTVEKINFDKMELIGQLIFHTTWELANRKDRIVVDKK